MPQMQENQGLQKRFSTFDVRYFITCPNIRQRGDVGGSSKKVGKRIKELERIYGIQNGGDHGNQYTEAKPNNSDLPKSQSDLAEQMGISVDTLQNYKLLADMIPELSDLVDTGIVTKTAVLDFRKNDDLSV